MKIFINKFDILLLDPYENEMPLDQKDRVNYQQLFASKVISFGELKLGECLGQGYSSAVCHYFFIHRFPI